MAVATTPQAHELAHYRAEFPIFKEKIYLNSCSLGAISTRVRRRVEEVLDIWQARGASAWYDVWWEALAELRLAYAAVIGAKPSEVALHSSVSTATAVLASCLDFKSRPKVVTTSLDFPTVAYQWLARQADGVELVVVQSADGLTVSPEAIAAEVDNRTALVATSHVFFTSGAVQDIAAVAEVAHAKGAFCFIDAYQSVGQLPVDVHATGVDFLSAGGLKWLLGGPGMVFLYVRDDLIKQLTPKVTGWFAHRNQFDFDPHSMSWHDDARRFEQGTPSLTSAYAQLGGLEIIREIGVPKIREVVRELTDDLIDRAHASGLNPKTVAQSAKRSAIVMIPSANPNEQVRDLAAAGIIVDARPGHVRLSPYFYNLKDDNAAAIHALRGG